MSSRWAGCQWEPRLPTLESRVVCEEDEVCVSKYKLCLWYVRRGMWMSGEEDGEGGSGKQKKKKEQSWHHPVKVVTRWDA